jgi:hypothetical protein
LTSAASADAQVGIIAGAARSTIAFGASSGSPASHRRLANQPAGYGID